VNRNPMLVLWDIDGTLLTTGPASRNALLDAAHSCLGEGPALDAVDLQGRLDSEIWREMSGLRDPAWAACGEDVFRKRYLQSLKNGQDRNPTIRLLPGVRNLVERLSGEPSAVQGVLSGNYPEIGEYKILKAGLPLRPFPVRVWGTDGESRRDLIPAARLRYERIAGRPVDPDRVIVIGDTPRDVDCARSNGCRSLAVATGNLPEQALENAGADLVCGDLSDESAVLEWIFRM
jgi:phosphoglycolate phosphatase